MKDQPPTANLQRISKAQVSISRVRGHKSTYPNTSNRVSVLNEAPTQTESPKHAFDLEERTASFGEAIVRFAKKIPRHPANDRLINQIVGCGTSVGANYCEANEGVSKKDFRNVIGRCAKEAKETKYFLRMIAASEPALAQQGRDLYREAKELHLIFAAIFRKVSRDGMRHPRHYQQSDASDGKLDSVAHA
jgi:four helix bundle protein